MLKTDKNSRFQTNEFLSQLLTEQLTMHKCSKHISKFTHFLNTTTPSINSLLERECFEESI